MEKAKIIFAAMGTLISYLYGGWSELLTFLLIATVIDYISGVLASAVEGKLSSSVGFKGIAKKIFIFLMVMICAIVDRILGDRHLFRDATIFFYLANEFISITENGGRMGLPMPDSVKQAIAVLRGKSEVDKGDKSA